MPKKRGKHLQEVFEWISELTEERGSKTRLATHLGVSPQTLSAWLNGTRDPSGEYALALLYWVNDEDDARRLAVEKLLESISPQAKQAKPA